MRGVRIRGPKALLVSASALAALVWSLPFSPATADTLRLKNGKIFEGILVEETGAGIVFDVIMGGSRMRMLFREDEVARIEKASVEERESIESDMMEQREVRDRRDREMKRCGLVLYRGKWVTEEEKQRAEEAAAGQTAVAGGGVARRPVAPAFEMEDLQGNVHSMYQYRGQILFLFFWQAGSRACASQIQVLKRASEKFKEDGVVILGINLDVDKEKVCDFVEARKIDFPILFAGNGWKSPVVKQYGVKRLPATYLVDRRGEIRATGIVNEYIEKEIGKLLNK